MLINSKIKRLGACMHTIQKLIKDFSNDKSVDTYQNIIMSLKDQLTLWIACSPYTENYYLDFDHDKTTAYIFTEKEFFNKFRDYLLQQAIEITPIENNLTDRMTMFRDIYRSGFEQLVIDNGQHYIKINIFDIIDKPDLSDIPQINQPIFNPSLIIAANNFFQHYAISMVTEEMERHLFKEIYRAKYLLVMDTGRLNIEKINDSSVECFFKENSVMSFPLMKNIANQQFYPFFTDWTELRKFDTEHKYSGLIVDFEEMKYFISRADGITINPYGVNIIITAEMLKAIGNVRKETVEIADIKDRQTKVMFGNQINYLQ